MAQQTLQEIKDIVTQALLDAQKENPFLEPKDYEKAIQKYISLEDVEVPEGKNGLPAHTMFDERLFYAEEIYPNSFEMATPLDLWYERPLLGKVDPEGDAIFSPQNYLKQLLSDNPNVWVLDFVADAFNDFRNEFLFLNKRVVTGTPFEKLAAQRGWSSAIIDYDKHMDRVYEFFSSYVFETGKDKEMVSFDKFMNLFYEFVEVNSPQMPMTLSQFIVSQYCSPSMSGLMIEIVTDSHGNDADKFTKFINDANFKCYVETAERFGFKIDKNFPGRLIADINSPVMNREGDSTIPPSQGGEGYMRKYPKPPEPFTKIRPTRPTQEIIAPPDTYPSNLFEPGDPVAFFMMKRHHNNVWLYTILRGYTNPENRLYGPYNGGSQTIIDERVAGAPVEKDAFTSMLNNSGLSDKVFGGHSYGADHYWEGAQLWCAGTILAINPSNSERATRYGTTLGSLRRYLRNTMDETPQRVQCPPNSTTNACYETPEEAEARANQVSAQQAQSVRQVGPFNQALVDRGGFAIVALNIFIQDPPQNSSGDLVTGMTLENFMSPHVMDWGNNHPVFPDSNLYGFTPARTDAAMPTGGWGLVMEIPMDALYMLGGGGAVMAGAPNPFIEERWNNRLSYPTKYAQWEQAVIVAQEKYDQETQDYDFIALPKFNEAKTKSEEEWTFFHNATRLAANNLFYRRYNKAFLFDLMLLKEMCMQFYYTYTADNPTVTVSKLINCGGRTKITKQHVIKREQISHNLINEKYPETYWLKQYILIRNAEAVYTKSFDKLRVITHRALDIYKKKGIALALQYIKKRLPSVVYKSAPKQD